MKIYVVHASSFDFKRELYEPLSTIGDKNGFEFIFPHAQDPVHSKNRLSECDLILADVSYPSIGMGIELGWASDLNKNIVCIYRAGTELSRSLSFICQTFIPYSSGDDLIRQVQSILKNF